MDTIFQQIPAKQHKAYLNREIVREVEILLKSADNNSFH